MKRIQAQTRVIYKDDLPSMTDQSFKNEVNVNTIMKKYFKTRELSHVSKRLPQYLDVSNTPDLIGAFDKVAKAEHAFQSLPSVIRSALNNDPRNLSGFLLDPKNKDILIEYGLLKTTDDSNLSSVKPVGASKSKNTKPITSSEPDSEN
jgi:phage internal scaffolding protein